MMRLVISEQLSIPTICHLVDRREHQAIVRRLSEGHVTNVAQSFVPTSWHQPMLTGEFNALGVGRVLEAIRHVDRSIRFYQASSSEMFGKVRETPQNEETPFHPRSPYGVAKVYAHYLTVNYRESYDLFAVSGILFNHESPRLGPQFVTRKVSNAVARIHLGRQEELRLGNLEAKRDWGYVGDSVRAMWLMLQQDEPTDYVVGLGETHSVRQLVERAFEVVGTEIVWEGEGVDEVGIDADTGKRRVVVDEEFFRPAEVDVLIADASKAQRKFGWEPEVNFDGLVEMMVEADLVRQRSGDGSAERVGAVEFERAES